MKLKHVYKNTIHMQGVIIMIIDLTQNFLHRVKLVSINNENRTIQNLWDAAKAVLRGKFIAIQVFLKKQVVSISLYIC